MKKDAWIFFIIILAVVVVIASWLIFNNYEKEGDDKFGDNVVVRVIDGDTIEMVSGEIIRLICIDAPEDGAEGYEEAGEFLESLVLNEEVELVRDVSEKDMYGRLLRYVYVDDMFVNREMVANGYAKVYRYGNDTSKCDEIENGRI